MLVRNDMNDTNRSLAAQALPDDEIDLMALFGTLWRGKLWIALAAFIGLVLGGVYVTQIAVPKYTSTTVLAIQEEESSLIDIPSAVGGLSADSEAINTEIEVIRSRGLLETVVTELSLLEDPEFNPTLVEHSLLSLGTLLSALNLTTKEEPTRQDLLNEAVKRLGQRLGVAAKRQTYIITISVTTDGKEKSQLIANTIAETYRQDQVQVKFNTLDEGVTWLSERVVELETELEERDAALKKATSAADYINVEGLALMNAQARELTERLLGEKRDAENAAANFALLNSAVDSRSVDLVLEATKDPTLRRLAQDRSASEIWGTGSPFMTRLDLLVTRARTDVERSTTQVKSLQDSVTALEARVDDQAAKLGELQQMNRELETVSVLYETFQTRLKETTIQQGIQSPDARVLSKAITGEKVAPRTAIIGVMSLILGAMTGAGIVLLRELKTDTFRNAEELEGATGAHVIGQVPLFPISARIDLLQYLKDKPTSAAVESIRNMRTSLLLSNMDEPPKVIMSTSTIPGEGKTTQSISLAQNLSGLGKRVLLVEGDIRRRTLDEYFQKKAGKEGLLSVITGEATLEETALFHDRLGADVLVGEKSQLNAADVFSSEAFKTFLEHARAAYDFVIIDTPPVLVVPDARVIGQHCDAIMYSVKWDSTSKAQVRAALNELRAVNLNVSGLVLSQIDAKGMKRYGYGDRGGAYGTYGGGYYDE
ncbi:polysaccharide biosynthesis tyrosine autokinase [Thalassobius sp. Cn5-15]|uniref:GumC family protein n=1 Tax=Thalassobius sp. Cn5-15 TaxID=2917763 RepID=UPI001EF357FC|nr:polysaccharide biosynthesis tyrosine autokinase [Thalassobius sp. Cn5-15]MCG7495021.1 polysaccharide biosynthesis tyrosine autokinase [Thalassobius sp. Cn5-15]